MADRSADAASRALFGSQSGVPGRRSAQDSGSLSKRDLDQLRSREAAVKAQAEKTAKLRALRLAKEAEDAERAREAADAARSKTKAAAAVRKRARPAGTAAQVVPSED
jgi:hypothetical protein